MLKRFRYVLPVAGAALLGGCADDVPNPLDSRVNTVINASIAADGSAEARSAIDQTNYSGGALGILWCPTDTVGVFSDRQQNAPFVNQKQVNAGRTQFRGELAGEPLVAYFPYSSANDGREATDLVGTLPAAQHWNFATQEISGDYKYGVPRKGEPDEFDFNHLFALLKMTVDFSGTEIAGEHLLRVALTGPQSRTLSGDFSFSAVSGEYQFAGATSNSVALVFDEKPEMADKRTYTGYLSCAPELLKGDAIEVAVVTDKHRAAFPAKMLVDFEAGKVYNFNVALKEFADVMDVTELSEPKLTSFEFTVAANPGKILATKVSSATSGQPAAVETAVTTQRLTVNEETQTVSGMIPYLYDFNLVATFSVGAGVKAYVNDVEQESGKSVVDFTRSVKYRLVAADGGEATYTVSVDNTGLPVMVINQSTATLAPTEKFVTNGVYLRPKDTSWVDDDEIAIYDRSGRYTMAPQAGGIRLRGNTSQEFPKLPLAVKLKSKAAIGDMPKHKRWVLLANWLDASLVRNHVAFEVARATEAGWQSAGLDPGLIWNPHGVNVELVVDGRHVGNYYLCEQIKIDKNRVAIKDEYADRVKDGLSAEYADCGFLIECDDALDEAYTYSTSTRKLPFMLKDDANPGSALDGYWTNIKTKVQGIEDNLKNGKYEAAYADLDINSVIDQWIVFELTMNNEYRHPKSVYMYMDGGDSKLCAGPVWDFDWQTFPNASNITSLNSKYLSGFGKVTPPSMSAWMYSNSSLSSSLLSSDQPYMWYPYLFKDKNFQTKVQERWAAIYPYLQAVSGEIFRMHEVNAASWAVDHEMWPQNFKRTWKNWCFNGDEDMTTYQEVIENLNAMYTQRLEWMNSAITGGNFVTNAK